MEVDRISSEWRRWERLRENKTEGRASRDQMDRYVVPECETFYKEILVFEVVLHAVSDTSEIHFIERIHLIIMLWVIGGGNEISLNPSCDNYVGKIFL